MKQDDLIVNRNLLDEVRKAGFKPIGYTTMICEETFIFKSKKEATDAWRMFKNDGFWYNFSEFIDEWKEYINDVYDGNEELAPIVYWFDKNYEPKT